MNDIDRLLSESLKGAGESYSPRDAAAAREEFATRRRRRFVWQLSGGVALAGAAVAAALFFASAGPLVSDEEPIDPGPMEIAALQILTRFDVGEEPLAIGAGDDYRLWIASRTEGNVSRIDLNSGEIETVDLPGANEIVVGAENVWVSGENGDYLRINEANPRDVLDGDFVEQSGGAQLIDLAVGGDAQGGAWAVDTEGCLWELTIPSDWYCAEAGYFPTDVATDEDEVWVLDSGRGIARQMNAEPGINDGRPSTEYRALPASEYGDLTMTDNALWVSGGGRVDRVDLETGEVTKLEIDGDYADLAVGPETVWALAGWAEGDERARVYELSHDLEIIGVSGILSGEPSDLVADANGVWITVRYRNEVIYLSRGETTPPVPPDPDGGGSEEKGNVVMVFGKDGDIWAAYADGAIGALTQTGAEEAHPVLVEIPYRDQTLGVLFDRVKPGKPSELVLLDLADMSEAHIGDGSWPANSGDLATAWLGNSASVPWVTIADLFTDFSNELTIEDENNEPVQMSQLAWDRDGRFVYGLTADGRIVSIDSTGEMGEVYATRDPRFRYSAVASGGSADSVWVIRVSEGGVVELGELTGWTSGSPEYHSLIDLSALPWAATDDFTLTNADGLSAMPNEDGTVTWGPLDAPAWVVSDGVRGFLVDEEVEQELPWEIHDGADVNEERNLN